MIHVQSMAHRFQERWDKVMELNKSLEESADVEEGDEKSANISFALKNLRKAKLR